MPAEYGAEGQRCDAGLVGLGRMGRGLGKNVLEGDFSLVVYDIDPDVVAEFTDRGAVGATSLQGLIENTDVVATCLPSISSIQAVYEAPDGIIANARPGMVVVDFSTSNPEQTRRYGALLNEKGAQMVDTPMLRNPQASWDGTLQLLVSGPADAVARVKPILSAVSEDQIVVGELGNAQAIKLLNNAVTIANGAILCEVFAVAQKLDVDLETLYRVMDTSFASSKKLHRTVPRLINDDHTPSFSTDISLKDIDLFTRLASDLGAWTPITEATRDLFRLTSFMGYGDEENTRIATILAKIAGTEFSPGEGGEASS